MRRALNKLDFLVEGFDSYFSLETRKDLARLFAATSHRLGVYDVEINQRSNNNFQLNFEPSNLTVLKKVLQEESGDIYFFSEAEDSSEKIIFKTARLNYQVGIKEGWLDCNAIIPDKCQIKCVLDQSYFLEEVKSLNSLFGDESKKIILKFKENVLLLIAVNDDSVLGRANINSQIAGETGTIILNGDYLKEVLEKLDTDESCLEVSSDKDPVIFKPANTEKFSFLVMPKEKDYFSKILSEVAKEDKRKHVDKKAEKFISLSLERNLLKKTLLGLRNYYSPDKMPWMFIAYQEGECVFRLPGVTQKIPASGEWSGTVRVPASILSNLKRCCESNEKEKIKLKYGDKRFYFDDLDIEADRFKEDVKPGVSSGVPLEEVLELYASEGIEGVKKRGLYRYAKPMEEKFEELSGKWFDLTELSLGPDTFAKIFNDYLKAENIKEFVKDGPEL